MEYKSSILLGFQLEDSKSLNTKVQTLIKSLNNTKIDLDINIKNSDVAKQLETLTTLANNFKSSLGGNISLGNINEVVNQATATMTGLSEQVLKTRMILNQDGTGIKFTETANGIGTVVKQVEVLNQKTKEWEQSQQSDTIIVNNEKIRKTLDDIASAQERLNILEKNKNVDINEVDRLRNLLSSASNNISTKNDIFNTKDISGYLNEVKQLEAEEQNLQKIEQERIQQLQKEIDLSNKLIENEQKQKIKDDSSNLKQLEQEHALLQKQAEAYQHIDVLKSNGIINESDISKLEQMVKNSKSLQDVRNAINSIMNTSMMKESSIVTMSKQLDDTQIRLDKLKQKFGEKLPQGFVESTQAEINKLKEDLTKVDSMGFNSLKNRLNQINTEMKVTTNETQQLVNSLKETNNSGFFGSMSNFLSRIGVFYGVQQVVQEISQQFKNATEYTRTLDSNITNIQMITGKTRDEVVGITNQFKELGAQLHITNQEMLAGSEELMRAGYDNSTTSKMLEASSMASKISGQTTQATTEQLIAIKNSFDMTGDQMQHVIDVISKLDNTSATSFKEISSAIMRTAFSAQQAGTSFDTLSAYVTTVSEKTRRSAETIGEAFKSVYSRYYNIKLGNVDEEGKNINDVEKAMNRIGIAIRSSKGEFKDFDVVLNEFVKKYQEGKLSQVDFMTGINTLGGTRKQKASYAQKCT